MGFWWSCQQWAWSKCIAVQYLWYWNWEVIPCVSILWIFIIYIHTVLDGYFYAEIMYRLGPFIKFLVSVIDYLIHRFTCFWLISYLFKYSRDTEIDTQYTLKLFAIAAYLSQMHAREINIDFSYSSVSLFTSQVLFLINGARHNFRE